MIREWVVTKYSWANELAKAYTWANELDYAYSWTNELAKVESIILGSHTSPTSVSSLILILQLALHWLSQATFPPISIHEFLAISPSTFIYPAMSNPPTNKQVTRIENTTEQIVGNARTLDAKIDTQWARHKGPRWWLLMEKIFEHIQIRGEESSHAAYALKKRLEECTDQDFEDMGRTRQEAEQVFQLLETLTPLAI